LEITLAEAILGKNLQYMSFDGNLRTIDIKPGTQANENILFKNTVF